ncbi:dihydropteroate synthase [Leucobacter weissii]|uniref:7,8-dihydroneopterin aldolase n=1 Tax=Leucobacter weissii TaxID=1983706 RepID=A0A939SA82_9MICO|nr:dihydropteroate synthase [Leucobacter weissii]
MQHGRVPDAPPGLARDGARPLVLGILNVTPDSFSDGGRFLATGAAVARGLELAAQGADVVDVGGESTRPGAAPVPPAEEQRRVVPVVEALASHGVAVSIDTLHAETARAAVAAGASIVNDVSGGLHDPAMHGVVADAGVTYIAMHWRGIPDPAHRRSGYADVVLEVADELARLAEAAVSAGIAPERIVLDPGLGFDKTAEQGWRLLAGIPELRRLGHPVLVGISRKRMIAETLAASRVSPAGAAPPSGSSRPTEAGSERDLDLGTAVVSALAAGAGVWGVRVHEAASTARALAVSEAWAAGRRSSGPAPVAPIRAGGADRIALTGLEVFAHHGVYADERANGQRFLIDAELSLDLAPAAGGDDLAATVHYGELAEAIVAAVRRDPVDLIETVAERVAEVALGFGRVSEARVTVHKPDAPIRAEFADVSVTVVREAHGTPHAREQHGGAP